ncbi:hypothetical protein [Flavobacterium sp. WC2416]|uniref:Type II CBASS E2 protein domain-containing protein n=1 Tax=Flavobacterium sp. WC2416 TaxID=3234141 RepID=A0AB39WBB7_9FLAO
MNKPPKLTIAQQYAALKRNYGFGETKMSTYSQIFWEGKLKSSPLGDEYLVRVTYKKDDSPKIYVLEPKELKLPEGKNKLEHVYDHKKQKLCLYYPKAKEWNDTKTIASTIMPWTMEWLYHYEMWLITDEWLGGGIHPGGNNLK